MVNRPPNSQWRLWPQRERVGELFTLVRSSVNAVGMGGTVRLAWEAQKEKKDNTEEVALAPGSSRPKELQGACGDLRRFRFLPPRAFNFPTD